VPQALSMNRGSPHSQVIRKVTPTVDMIHLSKQPICQVTERFSVEFLKLSPAPR
jgi:hypothetical protein